MAARRGLLGGLAAAVVTCVALVFVATSPAGGGPSKLDRMAGSRIVFGMYGTEPESYVRDWIRRRKAGGVMLYARNFESRAQMRSLTRKLQAARPKGDPPLLILLDQEGGHVKRVPGAPEHSAEELGDDGSSSLARKEGRATAKNLRGIGINVNLAPVADVGRKGSHMEQTDRSYSRNPRKVARLSAAFAEGLRQGEVAATAKHFPGLGAARTDQDYESNRIELSKTELREKDGRPFKRLADEGIPLVMMSSAVYPKFADRAALFSKKIVTGELRDRIGFKGVALTDDLDTGPLSENRSPEKRALFAARAGNDLMMFAHTRDGGRRGAEALADAVRDGKLSRANMERAAKRIRLLRESLRD